MTQPPGFAKSCATAHGLRDGELICQSYLAPLDPRHRDPAAWRAWINSYLLHLASPMAGQRYVQQEFTDVLITEPVTSFAQPITLLDNWPIGTGDQTGLIGRYAATLRTPVLVYQRVAIETPIVLGPTWDETEANECKLETQDRLAPSLGFVLAMWASARRVGPPWEQPLA